MESSVILRKLHLWITFHNRTAATTTPPNSTIFNSFSKSYLGRPVSSPFFSMKYFCRSMCSMTSLKEHTASSILIIFLNPVAISTGLVYNTPWCYYVSLQFHYITKRLVLPLNQPFSINFFTLHNTCRVNV